MTSITLSEAQKNLPEIITSLHPGEELQILQNDTPIARLIPKPKPQRQPRQPGSAICTLTILSDDDKAYSQQTRSLHYRDNPRFSFRDTA